MGGVGLNSLCHLATFFVLVFDTPKNQKGSRVAMLWLTRYKPWYCDRCGRVGRP